MSNLLFEGFDHHLALGRYLWRRSLLQNLFLVSHALLLFQILQVDMETVVGVDYTVEVIRAILVVPWHMVIEVV